MHSIIDSKKSINNLKKLARSHDLLVKQLNKLQKNIKFQQTECILKTTLETKKLINQPNKVKN